MDAKSAKKRQIGKYSNPHISPKWRLIPTQQKLFFWGHQGYNMHQSDRGSGVPKWENPKRDPSPTLGARSALV